MFGCGDEWGGLCLVVRRVERTVFGCGDEWGGLCLVVVVSGEDCVRLWG